MPSTSLLSMKFFIFGAVLCISSAALAQRYSQTIWFLIFLVSRLTRIPD